MNPVKRPQLRKQVAFPLLVALAAGFALYLLHRPAQPLSFMTEPQGAREWAMRLLSVVLWLSVALVAVRALSEFVFFLFRKRKGYDAPSLLRDIFSLVMGVACFAVILRLHFPDIAFGTLLSGSALLGIILGLALQDTLGNLFAGISLHADKPFQVGDVIQVGQFTGVVESITWRAVKIRTFQNHIILIGNSQISRESIEVCPKTNANARLVFFGALYSDSPVKVIHVVREAVREADNVLRYMTPNVRIRNLGDSSVEYEVKYWLKDYAQYNDTDALVRQRIWYAFRRAGLTFAFPTQTLYLNRGGEAAAAGAGASFDHIAERLTAVDIFSPLTEAELATLAENATSRVFAPGELIIREGDPGSSMFVVHGGSVDVRVEQHGQARTVNTLREGDFFGEMALFTGEPRTANVVAAEETEVLEIGREAVQHLFDTNPDLVEALSRTIAVRRAQLDARLDDAQEAERESAGLLASIRRFFRLD